MHLPSRHTCSFGHWLSAVQVDPHSGFGVGVAVGDIVGEGDRVGLGVGELVGVGVMNALHVPSAVCSSHTPHFETVTTLHTYV